MGGACGILSFLSSCPSYNAPVTKNLEQGQSSRKGRVGGGRVAGGLR